MAKFRLSRRAEADLLGIGEFTLREWGGSQTARYLGELEACCQRLADNPALGRHCDHVRPGLRRPEHGKHVLFYRQERNGIAVSRIVHQRMLPDRHGIDEAHPNILVLEAADDLALVFEGMRGFDTDFEGKVGEHERAVILMSLVWNAAAASSCA